MSVHDNVLRATAFHALAACYPDLHRPMGGHPEHEILLKASEEITQLRAERALLLAYYQSYGDHNDHHCMCLDAGCDACEAAHAYQTWRDAQATADKAPTDG